MIRISGFPLYILTLPVILTRFPSMSESTEDFETGDAGGNPPGKGLVRIGGSDIQKRVTGFGGEHLGDDSFNLCGCVYGIGSPSVFGLLSGSLY